MCITHRVPAPLRPSRTPRTDHRPHRDAAAPTPVVVGGSRLLVPWGCVSLAAHERHTASRASRTRTFTRVVTLATPSHPSPPHGWTALCVAFFARVSCALDGGRWTPDAHAPRCSRFFFFSSHASTRIPSATHGRTCSTTTHRSSFCLGFALVSCALDVGRWMLHCTRFPRTISPARRTAAGCAALPIPLPRLSHWSPLLCRGVRARVRRVRRVLSRFVLTPYAAMRLLATIFIIILFSTCALLSACRIYISLAPAVCLPRLFLLWTSCIYVCRSPRRCWCGFSPLGLPPPSLLYPLLSTGPVYLLPWII
ncbi:hypothetical protein JB92DRAFT_2958391 [Gautieria morchelliformis]|nr:hypothetical protein JB92DRAFT_2958391 [Gautieria morchelliformis]